MASDLFNDLQHKVALVTGSSSGIGEAIVTLFSQLGAQVVVTGRNEEKILRVAQKCEQLSPFNYKPLTFAGDLRNDEQIEQLVKRTIEKHSKIDIVVNNAGSGLSLILGSLFDADFLEKYEKVMQLDLNSAIKVSRLTMPYLIESKGVIVNISSVSSMKTGDGSLIHSVSKAALDMVTKSLALEFGPKGVRVNSVNPGFIATPLTEESLTDPNVLEEAKKYSVLSRVGEPEEIAKAAVFLASNTSSFVTGTNMLVDGGSILK